MTRKTATTAHAILGLLLLRPSWRTYDITKQLRRNMRFFWPRAESRIYAEVRTLVERGLAAAHEERVGRRPRTIYAITDAGRQAVRDWLATPPRPTALECEPLMRVFLADFSTREELQTALNQVRADAESIKKVGRMVADEYFRGTAPFQDQLHVRALVFDFLWNHGEMLSRWADRAEESIDQWHALSASERTAAAAAVIRRNVEGDAKWRADHTASA